LKNWCSRNTPNAPAPAGTISASGESIQPRSLRIMYTGTSNTCPGTISVARISANTQRFPGKFSRASPYAASESTASTSSVTPLEMKTLLNSQRKIGISSGVPSTWPKFSFQPSAGVCGRMLLN
jgi:hypothetical protein